MAKAVMIQGTMSNAGKSFLVAGICRILKQDGYRVAPFKSQNMALNSYITEDGLEMGRAQVMQAEACGEEPSVYMNPILLKPTTDVGSQVIVNGVPRGNMRAADYFKYKTELIPDILNAWQKLSEAYDVIVIEGAGSPAEINLKKNDIVNMGLAELVDAPVLLVGDIDRGGVFAQLAGTLALLEEPERQRIKGFVMNKFRGDVEILRPGLDMLRDRCHVETIGVIPYAHLDLDDEDSLSERLTGGSRQTAKAENSPAGQSGLLKIAVIRLPRISNFTDFNVLQAMDGVKVTYVSKVSELGEPHMVILPGTKSTIADMRWLRESGLETAILKLHSRGVTIFGICGGFQMLGEQIADPSGVEAGETGFSGIAGMGLLPMKTVFRDEKVRRRVTGTTGELTGEYAGASEKKVSGYEIHMGQSDAGENGIQNQALICQKKNVFGTYVHGIFDEPEFRESFLDAVAKKNSLDLAAQTMTDYRAYKESQYDRLADVVRGGMDMKKLYEILGLYPENCFSEKTEHPAKGDERGFLHLYYGDGKGKTTAAVGLAVRAAGAGKKVVFCQFLKSGETGELSVLGCTPGIRILRSEKKYGFSWTLSEDDRAGLREIHTNIFMEAMGLIEAGRCDVLILDEICDALQKQLLDADLFYHYLETARVGCEWVLTGRNPEERIFAAADYVTQMKKERHPFDDGVKARRGIEF